MADVEESFASRLKSDLSRIKDFLVENENIINAHNVDFFTKDLWNTCLPKGIRDDLDKLSVEEVASLPSLFLQGMENPEGCSSGVLKQCSNLVDLLSRVRSVHLRSFPHVQEGQYFKRGLDIVGKHASALSSFMMSPKKAYEVDVMSQAVHDLVQRTKVDKVVDLGSGKGYLSQYLALKHGIPVLGIDSRESNTMNAEKRNEKTLKVWHSLLKRSQNQENSYSRTKESCSQYVVDHSNDTSLGAVSLGSDNVPESWESSSTVDNSSSSSSSNDMHPYSSSKKISIGHCEDGNIQNTVLPGKDDIPDKDVQKSCLKTIETSKHDSYLPVTAHVSSSAQIYQNLEALFEKKNTSICNDINKGIILVGLHTCGDLAPTAINIFIKDSVVKALCLVGCCYHLLSQPTDSETPIEMEENMQSCEGLEAEHGFPLSDFLKQQNFRVSRNATMVAQQAADRIASECKIPAPSIFYRAVLQVILKEKLGLDTTGMHVGRIGAKCKTFTEYIHKSFKRLGLENKMISDEEIQAYYRRFQDREREIRAFHQLRACIAPCIESVFLMDRLCYLHEKGMTNARIVAMFDPVKSPRCYAIIASKTSC
ncbi:methyltransferase-like protein 25 [Actinia tenebrosa]|uniref:Methyltransferase-like protein 25 n=1 Tax=Actinia tenebrosa TaxID=6105 RepID=A0A6P8J382_ACTTE|nr:methyltransferase-like protein 25 [Actinia tenebrosa]